MAESRELGGANNEGQDVVEIEDMLTQSNLNDLGALLDSFGVNVNDMQALSRPIPEPEPEEHLLPKMELIVNNRMIRLRYDSELSNRNKGKEELIRVLIKNYHGPVWIRMQTVDISNHKAHPFSLIGDFCDNEIYFNKFDINQFDSSSALCVCKATLRIPKKQDYENVLQKKHQAYKDNMFGIVLDEMKSGDYWTCNKSLKDCTDFRLHVEAFYENGQEQYSHLHKISDTFVNAKDGKNFEIHRIIPYAVSVDGIGEMQHSLVIILTADSYVPKKVKVIFTDNCGWKETASQTNVIKNVIECTVPAYKNRNITQPQKVSIVVEDTQKKMSTDPRDMEYIVSMADMDTTDRKRKKPTPSYNVPETLQSNITPQTRTQSTTCSTNRLQLKGKLRQKCKGPDNQQANIPNLTSVSNITVSRGPSSTAVSTVSMSDPSMFQTSLPSLSAQNQGASNYLFTSLDPAVGQSVANILAPSGAQISLGDNKPPKDFFQKYVQEATKEQQQQQLLQILQEQQQLGQQNQQHSLVIGSQDNTLYNHQQQQTTAQSQYLLVDPTTLQPQSPDNSDLDFFSDIEIDSAPDKQDEKKITANKDHFKIKNNSDGLGDKITNNSDGSGNKKTNSIGGSGDKKTNSSDGSGDKKTNSSDGSGDKSLGLSKDEKYKGIIQKEDIGERQKKSETEPEISCKHESERLVKNPNHDVFAAETSELDVKKSDKNQKQKTLIYERNKDKKESAECLKLESLDCKELKDALPSGDLESDSC